MQPSETLLGVFGLVPVRIALDHELVMLRDVGRLLRVIEYSQKGENATYVLPDLFQYIRVDENAVFFQVKAESRFSV